MKPFDYLNSINTSKKDIMIDDLSEKSYNAYLINRGLSYFIDTILIANEMNANPHLDKKLQYHFFINTIRKRKRFSKWHKATKQVDLEIVKEYYGYSNEKARQALTLLSNEQLIELRKKVNKGGKQ